MATAMAMAMVMVMARETATAMTWVLAVGMRLAGNDEGKGKASKVHGDSNKGGG